MSTTRNCLITSVMGCAGLLLAGVTLAQELPDWSGVWQMQGGTIFDAATKTGEGGTTAPGVREHPPYNAEYEARYQANLALRDAGAFPDPNTTCGLPSGFPRMMNLPNVYEFAVTDKQVWIIAENGPNILRIYTDREHPAPGDMWPTFTGDSVGHWEGETLVFDTLSLHSSASGNTILDRTGLIHSDAVHITSRLGINADGLMELVMTLEDDKALTAPWVVTKRYRRLEEGARAYDYACNENNRNPVDPVTGWTYTTDTEGNIIDKNPGQ
ncbi:MAG: hypothetical protein ACO3R5_00975 [Pseudohongiellaceae bacterium]|jgi:hypothetical protein